MTSKKIKNKKSKSIKPSRAKSESSSLEEEVKPGSRAFSGELPKDARETYEEPLTNAGFFKTNIPK